MALSTRDVQFQSLLFTGNIQSPVLFLCTGNTARSILGEAIVNCEGKGRFWGFSAGSKPKGEVHPNTLDLLARLNHVTAFVRSKSWDEFARPEAPKMDFVFTICDRAAAEESLVARPADDCLLGGADPATATGNEAERHLAFSEAYRILRNRISVFVNLPLAALDRLPGHRARAVALHPDAGGRKPCEVVQAAWCLTGKCRVKPLATAKRPGKSGDECLTCEKAVPEAGLNQRPARGLTCYDPAGPPKTNPCLSMIAILLS